ncbi:Asp-tRNA(Asn)/Glu-tRNA(Gln) amidotransferase subunit GatC [Botrimarina hoheduenensis]|uniref:Aspartyl/glutamyl-tRNA(Asn/Gln) amidotransferase subunit C n=1 Tax=Botrimarina hoheduenensis TaxID=2528000 RepID=A0A5C5VW66_9BACT|nr:Asp-tRNA(Asn)/Glu-tRNA(Gln) amidotransferase subunit GatC [Botrimarina hoheduenensis]TWT42926.1 Aspartyl/glutamyl-tRNA(Asn/Gln) amidotransferase subunit C [Botrimarina hoheduenensis]
MALQRSDVQRVALLARLEPTPDQIDRLATELAAIVEYVDSLAEVDTDGVEPLVHAIEQTNVLRPDVAVASLSRDAALANAPVHNGVGFRVPAVLGD